MEQSVEKAFRQNLALQLECLNVPLVPEYRVPGSDCVIDLFVPSLPRAAIEINTLATDNAASRLSQLTDLFAGQLLTFRIDIKRDIVPTVEITRKGQAIVLAVSIDRTIPSQR
jgi:hypothetical protein